MIIQLEDFNMNSLKCEYTNYEISDGFSQEVLDVVNKLVKYSRKVLWCLDTLVSAGFEILLYRSPEVGKIIFEKCSEKFVLYFKKQAGYTYCDWVNETNFDIKDLYIDKINL